MSHDSFPKRGGAIALVAAAVVLVALGCRKHEPPPPPVLAAKPSLAPEPQAQPPQPPVPQPVADSPSKEAATVAATQAFTPTVPSPPPIIINRPAAASRGAPPPAPAPSAGAPPPPPPLPAIGLQELNVALKAYHEKYKKLPEHLEHLILGGFISYLPQPPPDMKFVVDKSKIEVKIVRK